MIDYTLHVRLLVEDIVARTPALAHVDPRRVLVFARHGRSDAHGAFATCHSLMLPASEPAYYFWRDRRTGALSRRSEWFVTRSPEVRVAGRRISHLVSIALPRFCDQTLADTHKERVYERGEAWMAKLDTIVHELYHVDPHEGGIRRTVAADGRPAAQTHTPQFFRDVQRIVREYVASGPDPAVREFLGLDFEGLVKRHGGVAGTVFRDFPAFPQRYRERLADQPRAPRAPQIVPVPPRPHRRLFTEADLVLREFLPNSTRRLQRDQTPESGTRSLPDPGL
jgi:hypothetical protein